MNHSIPSGVITGRQVQEVFQLAKSESLCPPSRQRSREQFNQLTLSLETAAELNSPVIIQFSNGGCPVQWLEKGFSNANERAAIAGAGAQEQNMYTNLAEALWCIRSSCTRITVPKTYCRGLTDLLDAGEAFFMHNTGKPLYSSHMLDLSEEPIRRKYCQSAKPTLARMAKMGMTLRNRTGSHWRRRRWC